MAKILVMGLTDSGKFCKVNEDTFSCDKKIYPDMISGHEEHSAGSTSARQIYVVTEGFGGPTLGDLSGRIAQTQAKTMLTDIDSFIGPESGFDFEAFADSYIASTEARIRVQIKDKTKGFAGVSVAMVLILDNMAYVMNIGSTSTFLYRSDELYRLTRPDLTAEGYPAVWLGKRRGNDVTPQLQRVTLTTGDIFLVTSHGVYSSYAAKQLKSRISAPGAFSETVSRIHACEGFAPEYENRTTLALKIQNPDFVKESAPSNVREKDSVVAGKVKESPKTEYARPRTGKHSPIRPVREMKPFEEGLRETGVNRRQNTTDAYSAEELRHYAKKHQRDRWLEANHQEKPVSFIKGKKRNTASQSQKRNAQISEAAKGGTEMRRQSGRSGDRAMENFWLTFFKFLMLGIAVGLAIMLIVWYIVLG